MSSRTCLGSGKAKKNKGNIFQLLSVCPCPPSPNLCTLCSHLPFAHFCLHLLLVAFITATAGPSGAAAFQIDECGRWESLKLSNICCFRFFYYIGNIYVYILNSTYVITEHYMTWGLCWFCSTRVISCHRWTHSVQWFNSYLGIGLSPPPCWLFTHVVLWKEALRLCVMNGCGRIHSVKRLLGFLKSSLWQK